MKLFIGMLVFATITNTAIVASKGKSYINDWSILHFSLLFIMLQTCWSFFCFPFNHWVGIQFELAEFSARDCSNIGKDPIANIHECQQAATELGNRYGLDGSWKGRPKGCYMLYSSYNRKNIVFWNKREKGNGRDFTRPICRKMNT